MRAAPARISLLVPALGFAIALPGLVSASTPEAWAEFQADVEAKCRALVEAPEGARVQIEVSPEGSESYGAALVTVGDPAGGADRMICVFAKQSGEAQLTTPLPLSDGEGADGGGMGQAQVSGPTAGGAPVAEATEVPATEVVPPAPATTPAPAAATVDGTAPEPRPGG